MVHTTSSLRPPMGDTSQGASAGRSPRLVVLISGRGSNLQALVRALRNSDLPLPTLHVLSNVAEAPGLEWARSEGLSTAVVGHRDYAQREAFDAALLGEILAFAPDLVVLAGFMRILSPGFCDALAGRLINIHPSLLPVFTGLDTHRRALAAGVRLHGATVHAVTAELDHGPILAQGVVPVFHDDTPERLAARVLEIEHQLYPAAVRAILAGDICWTATGWHFLHPERFAPLLLHPLLMGSGPLPLQDALSAT